MTNALYQQYGGSAAYAAFAQRQLDYALGANPWGASFVVGAGSSFPYCMPSEIANLSGSLTGSGALQLGATVDGPSSPANFIGLGVGGRDARLLARLVRRLQQRRGAYEDNVVSYPSVEPADDYTAISLLRVRLRRLWCMSSWDVYSAVGDFRAFGDCQLPAVLAIDGGNSKTDLALIGWDGTVLAALRGPGASHEDYGIEGAMRGSAR